MYTIIIECTLSTLLVHNAYNYKQHQSDNIYNRCNFVVDNASKLHCFYRICIYMYMCMYTHNYTCTLMSVEALSMHGLPPIEIKIIIIVYNII